MAYVAETPIKSPEHIDNAMDYVSREGKALQLQKDELENALQVISETNVELNERATFLNCSPKGTKWEWDVLREAFHQNHGVIAHHYYQSFSPDDNITPEQAHKIGVELAAKIFNGYQCVVSTHIDKNHVHNHILVNSCHIDNGAKWHSNKTSLKAIRAESDKLCKRYGLSVIEKSDQSRAIDKTTYQLSMSGKSWKANLCKNLDAAMECCHSKNEFEKFFADHGYTVRYTGHHITIKKEGEKKGIRVDTLAKQFGDKYTKANLEKAMGYSYDEVELRNPAPPTPPKRTPPKSHLERLTERTFAQRIPEQFPKKRPAGWYKQYQPPRHHQLYSRFPHIYGSGYSLIATLIEILFLFDRNKQRKKTLLKNAYQFRITPPPSEDEPPKPFRYGTISYQKLTAMFGDNYTVTVDARHILQLANRPILYSAKLDREKNTASITVKAADKEYLAKLLELEKVQEKLDEQSKRNENRRVYQKLKRKADRLGVKLKYMKVTAEQLAALQAAFQEISFGEKDGEYTISYLPEDEERIRNIIHPPKPPKEESTFKKNNRIYSELKKAAALSGVKLKYLASIPLAKIEALQQSSIKFAYFPMPEKPDFFKIAYSESDAIKLNAWLYGDRDQDGIVDRLDNAPDINYSKEKTKNRRK